MAQERNAVIERGGESTLYFGAHLELLLTDNLLMGEAHDVHGLHCLLKVVLVLLTRDGNVTI